LIEPAAGGKVAIMVSFMGRFASETYAVLRIIAGLLFFSHGLQKLFGFPEPIVGAPPLVLYVAGPIELVGGALVAVGFLTREAAFLCSGLMAFAYWMAHGPRHLMPTMNGGELAVLYCFVFLFISANGAGRWSVDGK
jgi:putative oxidoreductase